MTHPLTAWRHLGAAHRPLALSGLAAVGLLALFLAGLLLDPRTIGFDPVWLKPTKFAVSITAYTFTLLWLLTHVRRDTLWRARAVQAVGWVVVATFAVEWLAIVVQAARGTTSHFNFATPFDATLYVAMGVAIQILLVANVAVVVLLLTQRFASPVLAAALRWGMAITVVGMAQAILMTLPTAQQLAGWRVGEPITVIGAHAVGVPDPTAPRMSVTGWRSDVGDLRVGHFVGLHAMQVIPLLAAALSRRRLRERQRAALVHVGAALYLGVTLLLTVQALRAQPLLRPDAITLVSFAAAALVAALAAWWILRAPDRGAPDRAGPDRGAAPGAPA